VNFNTANLNNMPGNYSGEIARFTHPLKEESDLDLLLEHIGDSHYVLLGEASHGTHEYYTWRMKITKRLIKEKDFSFIAVEGDWPDCYRVNRYVKNYSDAGKSARQVLSSFSRWPTWMWANWEMVVFAEWMKDYNKKLPANKRTGFYGLDVYSLYESLEAITGYLEKTDKDALLAAHKAIRCFEPYSEGEGQSYTDATMLVPHLCRDEVVLLLSKIRSRIAQYNTDYENVFSTEQNAIIAVNAEKYYNSMIHGGPDSWNIRDRHMMETLDRLMNFHGKNSKCIVWAHNTHTGDARATDMTNGGLINVGQLVAGKHAQDGVFSVGFGCYKGDVIAGRKWGDEMRKIKVPEARKDSWEHILQQSGGYKNKLLFTEDPEFRKEFNDYLDHRAIGVVYNPGFEDWGNYVPTIIPKRYDAFIFLSETTALHPLHLKPDGHQVPETYPFGF